MFGHFLSKCFTPSLSIITVIHVYSAFLCFLVFVPKIAILCLFYLQTPLFLECELRNQNYIFFFEYFKKKFDYDFMLLLLPLHHNNLLVYEFVWMSTLQLSLFVLLFHIWLDKIPLVFNKISKEHKHDIFSLKKCDKV